MPPSLCGTCSVKPTGMPRPTAQATVNISNSTFPTNRSSAVLANTSGTGNFTINVTNSTFRDNGASVTLQTSSSADLTFDISNNTEIVRSISNAIQLVAGSDSTPASQIRGTISGNVIGDGTANSGSRDMFGIALDTPWHELPPAHRDKLLRGKGKGFKGIMPFLADLEEKRYKQYIRVFLRQYQSALECPTCGGTKLQPEALNVRVGGVSIGEIAELPVDRLLAWLDSLELGEFDRGIAETVLAEARSRVQFLCDVGLNYLSMNRATRTLSGGEAQRIGLANSLGSRLVDTLYVLDEPSIGLHQRDNRRLIDTLLRLKALFPGRLYVELMRHGLEIENRIESRLVDLAYALDLPLVATSPAVTQRKNSPRSPACSVRVSECTRFQTSAPSPTRSEPGNRAWACASVIIMATTSRQAPCATRRRRRTGA